MSKGLDKVARRASVLINESYASQRVTGQQRYATEITRRLSAFVSCAALRPTGFWSRSKARVWAWVQVVLPLRARGAVVLSMTARAPLWRRRHVLVVHDLFVLTNPEWFSRSYVWTHAPLLKAQIRSAASIIAVSQPVADQLTRWRAKQVPVAPNAPSEVFQQSAEDSTAHTTLQERGLVAGTYFLAVGSRDPRKNLARLAEAYGQLGPDERRRHPLVVVGAANSIYRGQALHWSEGTVDTGYVSDDELRRLYAGARSVVFISEAEGFGLPLVEAATAGAQSLMISDIDVFRWVCGEHARYVNPQSTASILAGLRAEIADPKGYQIELERFSWNASAAVIGRECERVAARG